MRSGQFLMLHSKKDLRNSTLKIAHDYAVKICRPNVIKCYYDVETATHNGFDIPQHINRNSFISCIGAVIEIEGQPKQKHCLLNNTL